MAELVCPKHGPYDASFGTCPYCSGQANRPPAPSPLSEDDMPTDIGASPGGNWGEEDPTDLGYGANTDYSEKTDIGFGNRGDATETEIDIVDDSVMAILWVKEGGRRGRIHQVRDGFQIGRSKGDIILDDPKASNPHARFRLEDEGFELWDSGSKNGTYINGERVRAATLLKENDLIKIGDVTFVFKILD